MIPPDVWDEFRKHRKLLKKPMTAYAEKLILAKLEKFAVEGHDPVDILNTSIANGWQGIFAPESVKRNQAQWWASNQGIEAKAKELGLSIRAGETWNDLRGRIQQKVGH